MKLLIYSDFLKFFFFFHFFQLTVKILLVILNKPSKVYFLVKVLGDIFAWEITGNTWGQLFTHFLIFVVEF